MGGFLERWRWLAHAIDTKAESIGIPPGATVLGNWQAGQVTGLVPPGVIVYLMPGDLLGDTPRPNDGLATFKIFTVSRSAASIEESASQAVDIAWGVVEAVRSAARADGVMVRFAREKVQLDTVNTTISAALIEGVVQYETR